MCMPFHLWLLRMTNVNPCPAFVNKVDPDQLASEEAN